MTIVREDSATSDLAVDLVCVRADHHRRRKPGRSLTETSGATCYCPSGSADGHEWMRAGHVSLDVLVGLGLAREPDGSADRE